MLSCLDLEGISVETLPIHVFKDSFGPILKLFNEHNIKYQMRQTRSNVIMASSEVLEIVLSPAMWGALATILVVFIKAGHGRKITITTKNNDIVQAEGLTKKELESILKQAKNLVAVDIGKDSEEN